MGQVIEMPGTCEKCGDYVSPQDAWCHACHPYRCECEQPDPDGIGECRGCHRPVFVGNVKVTG